MDACQVFFIQYFSFPGKIPGNKYLYISSNTYMTFCLSALRPSFAMSKTNEDALCKRLVVFGCQKGM